MLRRLLLTALLATLAVALPAAAEEDPVFGLASGSDPWGCLPSDLSCLGAADACDAWLGSCSSDGSQSASFGPLQTADSLACRAWSLNWPDNNQPLLDTFVFDPDGCLRRLVWRTVEAVLEELPPAEEPEPVLPIAPSVISWI